MATNEENASLRKQLDRLTTKNKEIAQSASGEKPVAVQRLELEVKDLKQRLSRASDMGLASPRASLASLSSAATSDAGDGSDADAALQAQLHSTRMEADCLRQRVTDLEQYCEDMQKQYAAYSNQYEQLQQLKGELAKAKAAEAAATAAAQAHAALSLIHI